MKKILAIISVVLVTAVTPIYAGTTEDINQLAAASFSKDFVSARNISWQQEKKFSKVTFTLNGMVMFAYYSNENGELLAAARNILSDQLPLSLMTSVERNYRDRWISNLFEMAAYGETSYYITLENQDETLILKSSGGDWTVYKKEKK